MDLPVKILIIGSVKKGDSFLLRKKFGPSKNYNETWYSFGCEFVPGEDPSETLVRYIKDELGIVISPGKPFLWDSEVKVDHDDTRKHYIHLHLECEWVSGQPKTPEGLEKVEFVEIANLQKLDLVPPLAEMFKRMGYLP